MTDTTSIHDELQAIARGMDQRAKALRMVAEELAEMAETPPQPLRAEVLARELLKLDLCLVHKDALKPAITLAQACEDMPDDITTDDYHRIVAHLRAALIGH